jgi:hypothetical protein
MAIVVPIDVVGVVLAWRELGQRSDDRVRGEERAWRVFVLINPGNSVI